MSRETFLKLFGRKPKIFQRPLYMNVKIVDLMEHIPSKSIIYNIATNRRGEFNLVLRRLNFAK